MASRQGRIARSLEEGLSLPDEGPILLLHPPRGTELPEVARDRLVVLHPFYPDFEHWQHAGLTCHSDISALKAGFAAASIVYLPRAKALALHLIALAEACTAQGGVALLDGAKTDGVDKIVRELDRDRSLLHRTAKAHGKLVAWSPPPTPMPEDPFLPIAPGLVTRAGVFSADGPDPGSAALLTLLPPLRGDVADLGAGWGYLAREVLRRDDDIQSLDLVEADSRALDAARCNLQGETRAAFHWRDATTWRPKKRYDAVICNPPFHQGRRAEPSLGQAFIDTAAAILKPSGTLYLVANRHLPYEAALKARFKTGTQAETPNGYKIFEARKPIIGGSRRQ